MRETNDPTSAPSAGSSAEELTRIFNTALVASRAQGERAFAPEMVATMKAPAFDAILGAVRELAATQKISERAAAEQIITAFRKVDALWTDYLIQEGMARLKG